MYIGIVPVPNKKPMAGNYVKDINCSSRTEALRMPYIRHSPESCSSEMCFREHKHPGPEVSAEKPTVPEPPYPPGRL